MKKTMSLRLTRHNGLGRAGSSLSLPDFFGCARHKHYEVFSAIFPLHGQTRSRFLHRLFLFDDANQSS